MYAITAVCIFTLVWVYVNPRQIHTKNCLLYI